MMSTIEPEVEPTEEERKNGWDKASLTAYLSQRLAAQYLLMDTNNRQVRPKEQNHRYRPHRWRA